MSSIGQEKATDRFYRECKGVSRRSFPVVISSGWRQNQIPAKAVFNSRMLLCLFALLAPSLIFTGNIQPTSLPQMSHAFGILPKRFCFKFGPGQQSWLSVRAGTTDYEIQWQQLSRAGATPEMLMCRKQNKRALRKMTYVLGIGQQSMPETTDRKTTKSEAGTKM
ncbi:hypothetical protein PGT21_001245 [Puccinia graminis f. sp. tritici]|uniref:Uncharacterized protein n=1 Tax=Puccinia graminis f. sp. tritici TaxID=56615 RepID=A0A5B0M4V9_PUCGR|nr:hypothetical protein PGT21_001245 [Puccinia graminis f. sp. tritici]